MKSWLIMMSLTLSCVTIAVPADASVYTVADDAEGGTLLGGDFGGRYLLKRTESGEWDEAFNQLWHGRINGNVRTILRLADGGMLLGGDFTQVAGIEVSHFVKINRQGDVDPVFAANLRFDGPIRSVIATTDGFFLSGDFTAVGDRKARYFTLITKSGELDPRFEPQVIAESPLKSAVFDQATGTLLLGGSLRTAQGAFAPFARLSERGDNVEQIIELRRAD